MRPGEASRTARTGRRDRSVRALPYFLPVLLVLSGVLVGCESDATEPSPTEPRTARVFELREVLEAVTAAAPGFDSLKVTCIDTEGAGASGCLDPGAAAKQEVVLRDRMATTKYRLGPAIVTADDVASAVAIPVDPQSSYGWGLELKLKAAGTRTFAEATDGLVGKQVAVVVEGIVVSAPTVQEPITSGAVQVNNLYETDAKALAARLSSPV